MFQHFTNQYQLSKTLRFELRPVGKTLENIEKKGLLIQDEERAEDYKKVKDIIDRYHKDFISESLRGLTLGGVEPYEALYFKAKKDAKEQKEFDDLRSSMRKEISKQFTKHPRWSTLFAKELIKVELLNSPAIQDDGDKKAVESFKDFTTYFGGSQPCDADANGAYNIARKGLMLVERIKNATDIKKPNLVITNKEWLEFAQR